MVSTDAVPQKEPSEQPTSDEGKRSDAPENAVQETVPEETLEELLEKLNALIGLAGVKQEVTTLSMKLSDEAERSLKAYLHWLVQHKPENFANGREMRNLFELALSSQANELAKKTDISDEELNAIAKEDFPEWVVHPQNNAE